MSEINPEEPLRLYLIRHGEVAGSKAGKMTGSTDTPLSKRGLRQAHHLADRLAVAKLSAIYSSDLQRARMTAEMIARQHQLKVQQGCEWREIDMGEWEGRTVSALHEHSPGQLAQLFTDPASFTYPGGESFAAFVARVQAALQQLLTRHVSGEIALVAHGGVCRAIMGHVLGMPAQYWLRLVQDYGCLNVLDWWGSNPVLRVLNEGQVVSPARN